MTTIAEGDTLETVVLGCLLNGYLVLWTHGGESFELFRVHEPEQLGQLIASAAIARTESLPGEYQEIGLFDRAANTLIVTERPHASAGDDESRGRCRHHSD